MRPVPQDFSHPAPVLRGHEQSPGSSPNMAVELAGLANRRCVEDGHQPLDVVHHHAIEKALVPLLQCDHEDVPLQIVLLAVKVSKYPRYLILLRKDTGRKKSSQPECFPLLLGEGGALIQVRTLEKLDTRGITDGVLFIGKLLFSLRHCPVNLRFGAYKFQTV